MMNTIGKEGFIWWMGVVENRLDPEMLGRVQVRIFGWHTPDKSLIPTESLPWSHPIVPVNTSNVSHTPKEGDWVFGFFADGNNAQHPMVMGVLTGYPTASPNTGEGFCDPSGKYPSRLNEPSTSRLARGRTDGTVQQTRKRNAKKGVKTVAGGVAWDEPPSSFAPTYPRNAAHESESGHAFELDDTVGKERVALSHKIGTFVEYAPNGDAVHHVVKDSYRVTMGADYVSIEGDCNITVGSNARLKVLGKCTVEADSLDVSTTGAIKMRAGGALKLEGKSVDILGSSSADFGSGGKVSLSGSSATVQGATVDVVAAMVDLQSPASVSAPSGTGLSAPSSGLSDSIPVASGFADLGGIGSSLSKSLGPAAFSVDGLYSNMSGAIATGMTQLNSTMPLDKLTGAMQGLESNLNNVSGAALTLPGNQLNGLRVQCDTLVSTAANKGIDMNLDKSLLPSVPSAKTVTGKRLYPSTETITIDGVDYPIKG